MRVRLLEALALVGILLMVFAWELYRWLYEMITRRELYPEEDC